MCYKGAGQRGGILRQQKRGTTTTNGSNVLKTNKNDNKIKYHDQNVRQSKKDTVVKGK